MRRLFLSGLVAFGLAACGDGPGTNENSSTPEAGPAAVYEFDVSDARIRLPVGGRDVTAAFGEITASGGDVRLVAARADHGGEVELHTHERDDGVMRMREVEAFDLSAGEPFMLQPGGDHIMVFGLEDGDLVLGERFPIELVFEDADGAQYLFTAGFTAVELN